MSTLTQQKICCHIHSFIFICQSQTALTPAVFEKHVCQANISSTKKKSNNTNNKQLFSKTALHTTLLARTNDKTCHK